uniref:FAF domain-containing protein n=1 Tax=Kalanchoe fedtschenkoi TaxID=63787 RepID=A0A7N0VJE5_KALFE
MSSSLSNSLGLCASFAAAADEVTLTPLASQDADRAKPASLRRTLSADMPSKTWSVQAGLSTITSSGQFPNVDSSDEAVDGQQEDRDEQNRPSRMDIWASILSQKNDSLPPPYVHPLVRRSASALSGKSLEICTESLGSETGSDVFSSFSASETGDEDKEQADKQQQPLPVDEKLQPQAAGSEEIHVVKYNSCGYHNKKSYGPRSFPPPLPSLSRCDGASLHMHSRRENGRLILAAVSVPTQNNFHAQRQDGRLLLTFVNENKSGPQQVKQKDVDDRKEVFGRLVGEEEIKKDGVDEGEEDLEEVNTNKTNMKLSPPEVAASGVINVHRQTFVVNKLIRLTASRNTSIWTNKFNEVVKVELQAEEEATVPNSLTRSPRLTALIPPPPTQPSVTSAMAATFNAYEYRWRKKPSSATAAVFKTRLNEPPPPSSRPILNDNNMFIVTKTGKDSSKSNNGRLLTANFLVVKGNKGDEEEFIVPYFKGCKEPKRPVLLREPYCIATS